MARRVILSDDLTGEEIEDVKTHIYMVDNVYYEIDLGADSFATFEKALASFVKVSRETRRISATSKPEASQAERIRQWAVANGLDVSEKGRLSGEVIAAFEKAMESNSDANSSDSQTDTNPDETDTSESTQNDADKAPESNSENAPESNEKAPTKPRATSK